MGKNFKYDAFISYRHKDLDKAVASKLQKLLEGYNPPKGAKPEDFEKWHIFRDETELSSSSNLSEEIKKALEKSEYLIVICSKTLKDSPWCMQEIEYFKELHAGSCEKIIPLLIEGEPSEVFPEQICFELYPVEGEGGEVTYERREIEPLAASVVAKSKKESLEKLKVEFLRIASGMLGCSYDTLYNREHKRKIRNIITVGLIVSAFLIAFGLYTSAMLFKINNQKEELEVAYSTLEEKNEELDASFKELRVKASEMLTRQAKIYLEDGNRKDAVKSAVEALPTEEETWMRADADAEYVVANAASLYSSDDFLVTSTVELSDFVRFAKYSDDGKRILATDKSGSLYVIDAEAGKIVSTFPPFDTFGSTSGYIDSIHVSENSAFALSNNTLVCVSLDSGEILWKTDLSKMYASNITSNLLYNIASEMGGGIYASNITTTPELDFVIIYGYSDCVFIDKTSGALVGDKTHRTSASFIRAGRDGVFEFFDDGKIKFSSYQGDVVSELDTNVTSLGTLLGFCENDEYAFLATNIGDFIDYRGRLVCIDKKDFSVKYLLEYTPKSMTYGNSNAFFLTPNLPDETGTYVSHNLVVVVSGYSIVGFDVSTGEIIYNGESSEEFIICEPDPENPKRMTWLTPNSVVYSGALINKYTGLSEVDDVVPFEWQSLKGVYDIGDIHSVNNFFLVKEDSSLIEIFAQGIGNNFTVVDEWYDLINTQSTLICDNGESLFAAAVKKDGAESLGVYDVSSGTSVFAPLPERAEIIKISKNRILIVASSGMAYVYSDKAELLSSFNLAEMAKEMYSDNYYYFSTYNFYVAPTEGGFFASDKTGMFLIDLSGDEPTLEKIMQTGYLSSVMKNGKFVSFLYDNYSVAQIGLFKSGDEKFSLVKTCGVNAEFESGTISSVVNSESGEKIAFISKNGYIGIYEYGKDDFDKIEIAPDSASPISLYFTRDGESLIALCTGGYVVKYSVKELFETGRVKTGIEFDSYSSLFDVDGETVGVKEYATSSAVLLVDLVDMKKKADITDFLYYLEGEGKIVYKNYEGCGYYNYLTGRALVECAEDFLK